MKKYSILSFGILLLFSCASNNKLLHPENAVFSAHAPEAFDVVLETTKGKIQMEVRREWSPNGVDRFYNLVRHGYYDSAAVFRINKATWAQFGVAANPKIAQAWRHQNIPDDPRVLTNIRGTVDYAFKDPNGRTTQLFINLRDNRKTHDTVPFVPIARVTAGMEVADSLYNGYGERSGGGIRAGKQDSLFAEGNAWLLRRFPKLDYILRARIIEKRP